MCRLFLSIGNTNTKHKIYDFLKQSDHPRKNTPGIDNYRDHHKNKDGFGFAWFDKEWKIYKQPMVYYKDQILEGKINHMKKDIIIGQIKNNDDAKNTSHNKNIHPFIFENQVFAHNGHIKHFTRYKPRLLEYIDDDLQHQIVGDTDTEFLFFMFLSILRKYKNKNKKRKQILQDAMTQLFQIFQKENIEIMANFIYADDTHVLVTRYIHYDKTMYTTEQHPHSLYYSIREDGILITSEPITEKYTIMPNNNITVIHWRNMKQL